MAATVTLASTTLTFGVDAGADRLTVASTSGMTPGLCLFMDQECFSIIEPGGAIVVVKRGVNGSPAQPHAATSTIYIARPQDLYEADPVGVPPSSVAVTPWINVLNGRVWWPYGDEHPAGQYRAWVQQSSSWTVGALGVRTVTTTGVQI